jgi:hypothetical protein
MAWLRSLCSEGAWRRRARCARCRGRVFDFERHCPGCGALNPGFDHDLFTGETGATLAEAVYGCRVVTGHLFEALAPAGGKEEYCPNCGTRMGQQVLGAGGVFHTPER